MNLATSPLFMKDNECEIIQNYNLDNLGSLTKRKGTAILVAQVADNKTITGIHLFSFESSLKLLAAVNNFLASGNVIWKMKDDQTGWETSLSPDSNNLTSNIQSHFVTFIGYVFRVLGGNTMISSADATTWGTTNVPSGARHFKYICVFEDRLYILHEAGTAKNRSRIAWSSLPSGAPLAITWAYDGTTAAGKDAADINPDDNDIITWGEPFGKVLLIFKMNGLYRWTFGQVEADRMPGSQGTPQGLTVKQTQGICFWANRFGVWALSNPYGIPKLISEKVRPFFEQLTTYALLDAMRAEVDRDHYRLSIGTVTVNNETFTNCVLVYTISKNVWHIETFPFTIKFMKAIEISRTASVSVPYKEKIYIGDDDGYFYETEVDSTYSDVSGATTYAINGRIVTKEYLLRNFPHKTDLKRMWFLAKYGIGTRVNYRLDRIRDTRWETFSDIAERFTEKRLSGKGRTIQLSITDNSIQRSQVEGFLIENNEKIKTKNA